MMNMHSFVTLTLPSLERVSTVALPSARRWWVSRAGCLTVQGGRAWITRDGDIDDHVLSAGEHLYLTAGDVVTVGAWRTGEAVSLAWRPDTDRPFFYFAPELTARLAIFLARGARRLAGGLLVLARNAEASACRAQGSICRGDSIASAGAAQ